MNAQMNEVSVVYQNVRWSMDVTQSASKEKMGLAAGVSVLLLALLQNASANVMSFGEVLAIHLSTCPPTDSSVGPSTHPPAPIHPSDKCTCSTYYCQDCGDSLMSKTGSLCSHGAFCL